MPILLILLLLAVAGCAPNQTVDMDMLERCQMRDLQGKETYVFRRDGCIAEVRFDDRGQVLSFEPLEDTAGVCRKVIEACGQ